MRGPGRSTSWCGALRGNFRRLGSPRRPPDTKARLGLGLGLGPGRRGLELHHGARAAGGCLQPPPRPPVRVRVTGCLDPGPSHEAIGRGTGGPCVRRGTQPLCGGRSRCGREPGPGPRHRPRGLVSADFRVSARDGVWGPGTLRGRASRDEDLGQRRRRDGAWDPGW